MQFMIREYTHTHMKKLILSSAILIFICFNLIGKTTLTPIDTGNGFNSIQLVSTDDAADNPSDQRQYAASIAFIPAREKGSAKCMIYLSYLNDNGVLENVVFDNPLGYELLFIPTSDDLFEGSFPKIISAIVDSSSPVGPNQALLISGVDYNYLLEILKRNNGKTTIVFNEGYTAEFDYDALYFSTLLDQCIIANKLGIDFYDLQFSGLSDGTSD